MHKKEKDIIGNISTRDILYMLFEQQAVMDAILDEMDRKAVTNTHSAERRGHGVRLVASRCSTCKRLEANGGDCEVGYGVYPACRDWVYHG